MISYGHGISGYIISIISLIHGLLTSITSCLVLIIVIYHLYKHRLKREEKTTLVLIINIYILILLYAIALTSINIQSIIGDMYGKNFYSSLCIFRAYFICVMLCSLNYAFVIQAFFRLCRIVYSQYRWLQLFWFYIISTPAQIIIASALLCPILILQYIVYLSNDVDCFISFQNIRGILYAVFIAYSLPLSNLLFIYIRITLYLRQQPINLALAIKRRQKRDLLAIRRIFINVGLLIGLGLPGIVVILMTLVMGREYPLAYRIMWLGAEVSTAILSIEMIFTTPQLKNLFLQNRHQNRVMTVPASIVAVGPVTTAQ